MTDVFDRVSAMSVLAKVWPSEPSPGSGFAADNELTDALSTFNVVRHQLLSSIQRLRFAARLAKEDDGWGSQILMLRPALVLAAKAAWVVRPGHSDVRVGRALGMISGDHDQGARAMRKVVKQGGLVEFEGVADKYKQDINKIVSRVSTRAVKPPPDETLIHELGSDIDRHDGITDAGSSMQLLWNASSSLAHGENWFRLLSNASKSGTFADIFTAQSLDVVCSGISATSSRILVLASFPAASGLRD